MLQHLSGNYPGKLTPFRGINRSNSFFGVRITPFVVLKEVTLILELKFNSFSGGGGISCFICTCYIRVQPILQKLQELQVSYTIYPSSKDNILSMGLKSTSKVSRCVVILLIYFLLRNALAYQA